jgi:transcriptional regulator with XRE-family HTH domain
MARRYFNMDIGFSYRLRKAMADKNMKASELSRLSGVGKADISNYINFKYVPKQDKCYMLAEALGCDPGWLMTGDEPILEERVIPIVVPDSERFVKLVKYMPEDDYQMVMHAFERAEKRLREEEEKGNDQIPT